MIILMKPIANYHTHTNFCDGKDSAEDIVKIAIEKGFQKGGDNLREQGYRIESLAIIDEMSPSAIEFRELN